MKSFAGLLVVMACLNPVAAEDWPRFRGPDLNGVSAESINPEAWGDAGPPSRWTRSVGTGMSNISIVGDRLFTMGNTDNVDSVVCLRTSSGETIWQHDYPCATDPYEFEGGPTATPTVDVETGMVFTLSRRGDLFGLDADTGQVRWQQNMSELANVRIPAWGFSGSPFVYRDLVLVNVGDAGAAVNKHNGELVWSSGDNDAGYSSMVLVPFHGADSVAFGSARSYVGINPTDGRELWRQRWLTTFGCNAADPIIFQGKLFLSSGYNRGSALVQLGDGEPEMIWKNKDMQNQLSTSVLIGGFIYGVHGDVDAGAELRCIDPNDGSVKWTSQGIDFGAISATRDHLITLSDTGELIIVEADPSAFGVIARQRVLDGKCWVAPVLANGRIYCRSALGDLVCVGTGVK